MLYHYNWFYGRFMRPRLWWYYGKRYLCCVVKYESIYVRENVCPRLLFYLSYWYIEQYCACKRSNKGGMNVLEISFSSKLKSDLQVCLFKERVWLHVIELKQKKDMISLGNCIVYKCRTHQFLKLLVRFPEKTFSSVKMDWISSVWTQDFVLSS